RRSNARPLSGCAASQKYRKCCRCTASSSSSSGNDANSIGSAPADFFTPDAAGRDPFDFAKCCPTPDARATPCEALCEFACGCVMMFSVTKIDKLMERMTLAEKLGQLTMTAAGYAVTGPVIAGDSTDSIRNGTIGNLLNLVGARPIHDMQRIAVEESRLGIPLLIGLDVIHGHRTQFPVPLAETATFDPRVWELTARAAARGTSADGLAMAFAPMLDISRDPRWGRTVEGPGEDPWIAVQLARAKVRGFQGADLAAADSIAATAKHFVAYGPVTAGRDYAPVDISE